VEFATVDRLFDLHVGLLSAIIRQNADFTPYTKAGDDVSKIELRRSKEKLTLAMKSIADRYRNGGGQLSAAVGVRRASLRSERGTTLAASMGQSSGTVLAS
jgi:hypothetical protein